MPNVKSKRGRKSKKQPATKSKADKKTKVNTAPEVAVKPGRGRRLNAAAKPENAEYLEGATFPIEKTPPKPERPIKKEILLLHGKLDRSIKATPLNGAMIIPAAIKSAAQRYLKTHADFSFRYYTIHDNPDMLRVYKYKR